MRAQLTHLAKNKIVLGGLVAAIVLALVGTTTAYASLSKSVTLSVDGKEKKVRTFGGDVGDVLAGEGIKPSKRDSIVPGVDAPVKDGSRIAVRIARPLTLNIDGDEQTHWTTATEVDTALDQIGVRTQGAELSVSRSADIDRSGMTLSVITPKAVKLKVGDGRFKRLNVPATTVGDLLQETDANVDRNDQVRPSRSAELTDGARIVVTKLGVKTKRVPRETIPAPVKKQEDDSIMEGETKTVREGTDGVRDVTYKIRFRNGDVVKRSIVKLKVLEEPTATIIKVGTKEEPEAPAANFASGGTVWDQIAQCESGGNWAANTGNGYYGGLQFSQQTWKAYGGPGMPHEQSRETQIAIAEKVRAARGGYGDWPHCGAKFG